MKRIVMLLVFALVIPSVSFAFDTERDWKVGIHGVYSSGGDVNTSKAGFGVQAEFNIGNYFSSKWAKNLSLELAISKFSDKKEMPMILGFYNQVDIYGISKEMDITSIGLSLIWQHEFYDRLFLCLIGGLNYNLLDADVKTSITGLNYEINYDNKIGSHVGGRLYYNLPNYSKIDLFVEYRYTFLKTTGNVKWATPYESYSEDGTGNYDFGILKFGIIFSF